MGEGRNQLPEPWLRGPVAGVPDVAMPLAHSFAQVREDLDRHVTPLTTDEIWRPMPGGSLGFHLKHIAGSVDRLSSYLEGNPLTPAQMNFLREEAEGKQEVRQLLQLVDERLNNAQAIAARFDFARLRQARTVGRQGLPTTVLGLLVHLAEHTQRHLGQCITLAHILKGLRQRS